MPATITANPNPVVITIWSFSQRGPTTISWDTDLNNKTGTVWVTDGGGTRVLADHVTNAPAIGVTGSARTTIELGKKYLFELRRTDDSTLLASTTVEGREELGLPVKLLNTIHVRAPLVQGITNLRVLPAIDSVRITFRTRQPTVPVIEIKHATTQAVAGAAFPLFGGMKQAHDVSFPLAQNTSFSFHIFAAPVTGAPSTAVAAQASGLFRTGSRSAQVFFDRVFVHTDGDPGSLGDGEFRFNMGAGDTDSGKVLGSAWFRDDISGGDNRWINQSVVVNEAPAGLWVQVFADEDDGIGSNFISDPSIEFAPEGSVWSHQDDSGESEMIVVTKWFDLSDPDSLPAEIAFTLETGPKHIDFSLICRLRLQTTPGVVMQPQMTKSAKPIRRLKDVVSISVGERAAIGGSTPHVLQIAANGGLYRARAGQRRTEVDPMWTLLDRDVRGPATVVAVDDGTLHVLAPGDNGEVRHRLVSPDDVAPTEPGRWRSLGGSVIWPPAVAATKGRVDVFALNGAGEIFHSELTANADHKWTRIGEGVGGFLNAFTTSDGAVGLVVLGRDREVLHTTWSADSGRRDAVRWERLPATPGAPVGELSAELIDGVLVLAVLGGDETVHAAPWASYPEPHRLEWLMLGTVNELITRHYALLSLVKAEPAADLLT